MNKQKKAEEYKPLETSEMRVTDGGDCVVVGGQRFKRVVLRSAATASPKQPQTEAEQLLDELETEE